MADVRCKMRAMLEHLLSEYRDYMLAGSRSGGTIQLRLSHVSRALREIGKPVGEVTNGDLISFLAAHDWAPTTRRSYRASLRGFFQWATKVGHIAVDPSVDLPGTTVPRAVPRPAADTDILAALREAQPRVALMIELMTYGGLRRAEVCKVRGGDVNSDGWLRVTGKGGHVRHVPLPGRLAAQVRKHPGYVFPGLIDGHLSPAYVGKLVSRALPRGTSPHQLRHRYASVAYSGTHDIRAVQTLLGHAKLDTTMIYTAVAPHDIVRTAEGAWTLS